MNRRDGACHRLVAVIGHWRQWYHCNAGPQDTWWSWMARPRQWVELHHQNNHHPKTEPAITGAPLSEGACAGVAPSWRCAVWHLDGNSPRGSRRSAGIAFQKSCLCQKLNGTLVDGWSTNFGKGFTSIPVCFSLPVVSEIQWSSIFDLFCNDL